MTSEATQDTVDQIKDYLKRQAESWDVFTVETQETSAVYGAPIGTVVHVKKPLPIADDDQAIKDSQTAELIRQNPEIVMSIAQEAPEQEPGLSGGY